MIKNLPNPKEYWLKINHKMTLRQYNSLRLLQNNNCAICNRSQFLFERPLYVDHNHKTGKIRGLLCFRCNSQILVVLENYNDTYEKAKLYLKTND